MSSVAASRLVHIFVPLILGLTPQAIDISPLRGSGAASPHEDCRDPETLAAASRLRPMTIIVIRAHVSPLRGWGESPHRDGGGPACRIHDSRPAPKARQIFSLGRQPQETVRPTPISPEGATDLWPGVWTPGRLEI